jgi:hypothetical protein
MKRNFSLVAVHIALAAMLLRALTPAGWMPSAEAAGSPITICTMSGPVQLVVGPDGQPIKKQNQDDARHRDLCPFATAPHMAQPAATTGLALPSAILTATERAAHRRIMVQATRHAPQSPRAPPSFA